MPGSLTQIRNNANNTLIKSARLTSGTNGSVQEHYLDILLGNGSGAQYPLFYSVEGPNVEGVLFNAIQNPTPASSSLIQFYSGSLFSSTDVTLNFENNGTAIATTDKISAAKGVYDRVSTFIMPSGSSASGSGWYRVMSGSSLIAQAGTIRCTTPIYNSQTDVEFDFSWIGFSTASNQSIINLTRYNAYNNIITAARITGDGQKTFALDLYFTSSTYSTNNGLVGGVVNVYAKNSSNYQFTYPPLTNTMDSFLQTPYYVADSNTGSFVKQLIFNGNSTAYQRSTTIGYSTTEGAAFAQNNGNVWVGYNPNPVITDRTSTRLNSSH